MKIMRGCKEKLTGKLRQKRHKISRELFICVAALILSGAAAVIAAVNIIRIQSDYAAADKEYAQLRRGAPAQESFPPAPGAAGPPAAEEGAVNFSELNPDYIGWIRIAELAVDYPVVQGQDNEKYLNTLFSGEKNPSGTIFMDSGCRQVFDSPVAILYGHNMKNGGMFGRLDRCLNNETGKYPDIVIFTADEETLIYEIFAVRLTDVHDKVYSLIRAEHDYAADNPEVLAYLSDFEAPENTGRLLILSTCADNGGDDERLTVLAALK